MAYDFSEMSKLPGLATHGEHEFPVRSWIEEHGPEWTDYYNKCRETLVEKVKTGELTPQDADAALIELGGEPFEVKFQPQAKAPLIAMWSPEMVAAWMVDRELTSVFRHCKEHYSGKSIWIENECVYRLDLDKPLFMQRRRKGKDLIIFGKTSLFCTDYRFDGRRFDYSDMVWLNPLRAVLIEGKRLKATARNSRTGRRVAIKPDEWQLLEFAQDNHGNTILRKPGRVAKYSDIEFPATELRSCFPTRYGYTQERPLLRLFRPWKPASGRKLKRKEHFLLKLLKERFKEGFPIHHATGQDRLDEIKELMGRGYWHKDEDSFKRYLNRFIRRFCED